MLNSYNLNKRSLYYSQPKCKLSDLYEIYQFIIFKIMIKSIISRINVVHEKYFELFD